MLKQFYYYLFISFICALTFSVVAIGNSQASTYPKVMLDNEVMQVSIYLPDAENGYYRGARFDWSGIIEKVYYKNHTFYAPLHEKHNPTGHEFVSGPAEEFGMYAPIGYSDAKPGENFIKIGVGILQKSNDDDYQFYGDYKIVQPGDWQIESGKTWIEFRQTIHTDNGWGYRYSKRISLASNKAEMNISHQLTNIGSKPIVSDNYNHNFTIIDDMPYGPEYNVTFPFTSPEPTIINKLASFQGNSIKVNEPLQDKSLWHVVLKNGGDSSYNAATITNNRTNASVSFKGSEPVTHFIFWAVERAACPEPFITIVLKPNKQKNWQSNYTFSAK